jgi:hypothetical protein
MTDDGCVAPLMQMNNAIDALLVCQYLLRMGISSCTAMHMHSGGSRSAPRRRTSCITEDVAPPGVCERARDSRFQRPSCKQPRALAQLDANVSLGPRRSLVEGAPTRLAELSFPAARGVAASRIPPPTPTSVCGEHKLADAPDGTCTHPHTHRR